MRGWGTAELANNTMVAVEGEKASMHRETRNQLEIAIQYAGEIEASLKQYACGSLCPLHSLGELSILKATIAPLDPLIVRVACYLKNSLIRSLRGNYFEKPRRIINLCLTNASLL